MGFPLLLIPIAVYFILAFLMPGVEWTAVLGEMTLMSGAVWRPTFSDALIAFALLLLFVEIIKAARPSARSVIDNLLSTLIFVGTIAAFMMLPQAATSTFALLAMITFVDVIAGWTVARSHRLPREVVREVIVERPVEYRPNPSDAPGPTSAS